MGRKTELFADEPADTREAIMKATYEALLDHGYADLTIQRIGDEFEKSKSLLYHHYDSKDALLVDFLAFMLRRMEERVPIEEEDAADDQFRVGVDHIFTELLGGDQGQFNAAMIELRAQAAHDDTYHEQFTENDSYFHGRIAEIVQTGVDQGVFRDVDVDQVASFVVTTLLGAMLRDATTEADLTRVRRELSRYLQARLLAPRGPVRPQPIGTGLP